MHDFSNQEELRLWDSVLGVTPAFALLKSRLHDLAASSLFLLKSEKAKGSHHHHWGTPQSYALLLSVCFSSIFPMIVGLKA